MLVQPLPYAAGAEGSINKAIVASGGSIEDAAPQAYQQLLLLASISLSVVDCNAHHCLCGLWRWHLLCVLSLSCCH